MTWGNQNTEAEGHAQLDYAFSRGVNFIDTAELYPVPAEAKHSGRTSEIIGTWLRKTGNRDKVVIASKIAGGGDYTRHIRTTGFSPQSIHDAVNGELRRLQTDYIDLFQLHWPERKTNRFGIRDYVYAPNDPWEDNFKEVLQTLKDIIVSGKVKHIGLSNETAWGTMSYLETSKTDNLPRPITIQNSYSLLNRTFENDLAEVAVRENIKLLPYSPMAFGVLSGKYIDGTATNRSRINLFPNYSRYSGVTATEATKKYYNLAKEHNISLAQLSLAFVNHQPFVTSNIIGASRLDQLKENIESIHIDLSEELMTSINAIHNEIPNPAP